MVSKTKTAALWAVMGLIAFAGFTAAIVSPAEAARAIVNTVAGNPAPTCPKGFVFNKKTAKCDAVESPKTTCTTDGLVTACVSNAQATINGTKTVMASEVATGQVTILSFVSAHGSPSKKVAKAEADGDCKWVGDGSSTPWYWNSGLKADGSRWWFKDHDRARACHIDGVWRKVGPGDEDCWNILRFSSPHSHVIVGKVLLVRTFANVTIPIVASISVVANDVANGCLAKAAVNASIYIKLTAFVKAKGNVSTSLFANVIASLKSSVSASTNCHPATTVTTTTPGTTTTVPGTTTTVPVTTTVPTTTTVVTTTTPTTTTTPPPANKPPTGVLKVPQHLIVNGIGKVSVDSINDPDGDSVTVSFSFKDKDGNTLSLSTGPTFSDGSGVISMMIKAPSTPMNVYVYGVISDGKTNGQVTLSVGSFPVVSDPDPGK